ncbi:YoaK family protein [Clostridioides difficile]|uniref:YoaK family protein n=1 Tax=Clostridioides difficile TaxID=1496 RepID=UPI003787029C
MDIYTYVVRGKVFANAQTGNIVLFGLNIAEGNVKESFYYLIPILAFMLGVFMAEKIRKYFTNNKSKIHWRQVIIMIEMITILIVSFVPRGRFNMFVNVRFLLFVQCK